MGLPVSTVVMGGLLLFAGGAAARAQDLSSGPSSLFGPVPCPAEVAALGGTEGQDFACGTVRVPLRHADPAGPSIELAVTRIVSQGAPSHDRAVLILAPTVDDRDSLAMLPMIAGDVLRSDVLLVDQRGTGRSVPSLHCDEASAARRSLLGEELAADRDGAVAEAYRVCTDRFRAAGTDPAAFDSLESAADITDVAAAMGYPVVDLVTMGGGTRVAQAALRNGSPVLRTVTLDSVLPSAVDTTAEQGASLWAALQALLGACSEDTDCSSRFGGLEATLLDAATHLDAVPASVEVPVDGSTTRVTVHGTDLLHALSARMRDAGAISTIPETIRQAAAGDLSAVAQDLVRAASAPGVADGHALVRRCEEDQTGATADVDGLPGPLVSLAQADVRTLTALCAAIGVGGSGGAIHDPVTSDIPVLLLTGEFDPLTTLAAADQARSTLSTAYGLQLPGLGRGVLLADACPMTVVASFLVDPSQEPDASCIAEMPEFTTGAPEPSPAPSGGPSASAAPIETPRPTKTDRPAKAPRAKPVKLKLTRVADGFENANGITNAGDGRLFITEQEGYVQVLKPNKDGTFRDGGTFLDIRSRVICCGEKGFLGIAFPPDYAKTGYFYVTFAGTGHTWNLEERRVSKDDPDRADPDYKRKLIRMYKPLDYHWAGDMHFGPDGYLYVTVGDGGFGGKVKDPGDPEDRAQDLSVLFGKMLRIDPRGHRTEGSRYSVPGDNPFVHTRGAQPEIWAYGLRNPWRWSFDRLTGDLWIGDVGMWRYEEVDRVTGSAPGRGLNFGWRLMEGPVCYNPKVGCDDGTLTHPFAWYAHTDGMCAVAGGYVYRGTRSPALRSWYVLGDYCSGRLLLLDSAGKAGKKPKVALETDANISALGEGADGELYVLDYGAGNALYRISGRAR